MIPVMPSVMNPMLRSEFHRLFKCVGPSVLPVIHVQDVGQVCHNVEIAISQGVQGVFLINHDFDVELFIPIIVELRELFPNLWLGVNFLAVTGKDAFLRLGDLQRNGIPIDAYWADDGCIDERKPDQVAASEIADVRAASGWDGTYFGGVAFKKQRAVSADGYGTAATQAGQWMDVVTTSGVATGSAAELSKIKAFREALPERPLAIASGVTPENVHLYRSSVDAILVATGINCPGDFYNIDRSKLARLMMMCRESEDTRDARMSASNRSQRWYLNNMAPNVKGEQFAWLDPSAAYVNAQAFNDMLDDLLEPFDPDEIDVVAGVDAAGFVLGGAMAARLRKGFLTIRKAGKLPVPADQVEFVNYTKRTQSMEMRNPGMRPGTRVLLVDQWVETGGTMGAGIELIKRQGGIVSGIAAVCIEDTPAGKQLRDSYKCSTAVEPGSDYQAQCNQQYLEFFNDFDWEGVLP